jgi:hypothetical protein
MLVAGQFPKSAKVRFCASKRGASTCRIRSSLTYSCAGRKSAGKHLVSLPSYQGPEGDPWDAAAGARSPSTAAPATALRAAEQETVSSARLASTDEPCGGLALVRRKTGTGLYAGDDGSGRNAWARSLYQRLSHFSHSRGDTTNAQFWESNGPVYSAAGFQHTYRAYLETYAVVLLVAKIGCPRLTTPAEAHIIYKLDSAKQFLEVPFRALSEHYSSLLFGLPASDMGE